MAHNTTIIGRAPIAPAAYIAPALSEAFPNPDDDEVFHVKNGLTASSVTIVRPGNHPDGGDAIADQVVAIPASTELFIPLSRSYEDPTTRSAVLTFTNVTTVTGLLLVHART